MAFAISTVSQGGAVYLTMPACSINAGANTDVSGIEFDIKPIGGNAAGFFNIAGVSTNNTTAIRIEVASGTLQWRQSGTVYLSSAAGVAPMGERAKYGAEWEESTLSLYLTKNGSRIAGPYIAPSSGSLTTNIAWNQIGRVGTSSPSPQTFELYGVRAYGGNATYQTAWDDTGASGDGASWADDSATRSITITGHTGAANSWWMFYDNASGPKIGEGIFSVTASASVNLPGFKTGIAPFAVSASAAAIVGKVKVGQTTMAAAASAFFGLSYNKRAFGQPVVTASASALVYTGTAVKVAEATFAVSGAAAVQVAGHKAGHSTLAAAGTVAVAIAASKKGAGTTTFAASAQISTFGYKRGFLTPVVIGNANISIIGYNEANRTPNNTVYLTTFSYSQAAVYSQTVSSYSTSSNSGGY